MLILEPIIHETIWGGDKLKKYVHYNGKIGHLYLINGHENMSNKILNGNCAGMNLREAFAQYKTQWGLDEFDEFPITIALVDASNDLSIQVHPNDDVAMRLEGKKIGKTESWIFLDAPQDGWIYGGSNVLAIEEIKRAIEEDRVDEVTAHYPVRKMDCVTVNSGTLHSMTSGSLVYEIEYGSDFTYRFYDFDRIDSQGKKRELHIEKALEAIDLSIVPQKQECKNGIWLNEKVYEICYLEIEGEYVNISNEIECITFLEGQIQVDGVEIKPGMSIILFPKEKIEKCTLKKIIIARLIR